MKSGACHWQAMHAASTTRMVNSRTVSAIGHLMSTSESSHAIDPYSVAAMPEDIAYAFLRKVFSLFLLQQLLAIVLVVLMIVPNAPLYMPMYNLFRPLKDAPIQPMVRGPSLAPTASPTFGPTAINERTGSIPMVCLASFLILLALILLFCTKYHWPTNYISLFVFTCAQAFLFGGITHYFSTNLGWMGLVFIFIFTFLMAFHLLVSPLCCGMCR